jgi:hypothetical protein
LGRPLAPGRIALGDCDVAAFGGELARDGEAETCAGAGDDGDTTVKDSHAGERYGLRAADVARDDDVQVRVAERGVGAAAGDDQAACRGNDRGGVAGRTERRRDALPSPHADHAPEPG